MNLIGFNLIQYFRSGHYFLDIQQVRRIQNTTQEESRDYTQIGIKTITPHENPAKINRTYKRKLMRTSLHKITIGHNAIMMNWLHSEILPQKNRKFLDECSAFVRLLRKCANFLFVKPTYYLLLSSIYLSSQIYQEELSRKESYASSTLFFPVFA